MKTRLLIISAVIFTCFALTVSAQISSDVRSTMQNAVLEGKWQEVLKEKPADSVSQFISAVTYGVVGDFDSMNKEAAKTDLYPNGKQDIEGYLSDLKARYEDNPNVLFLAAVNHQQNGSMEAAIAEYQQAVKLSPRFAAAWYQLAAIYDSKGDNENNLQCCRKAVESDPGYAPAHRGLGNAYQKKGDYTNAIKAYSEAIQIFKKEGMIAGLSVADTYYNLGWIYLNSPSPDNDKAIDMLTRSVGANKNHASAYNELGIGYKRKGMYDKAIQSYKQVLALEPDNATAWFNIGISYYRSGKSPDAKDALKKAVALDPNGQIGNAAKQWLSQVQ